MVILRAWAGNVTDLRSVGEFCSGFHTSRISHLVCMTRVARKISALLFWLGGLAIYTLPRKTLPATKSSNFIGKVR